MGTEAALAQLHGIATGMKAKAVKARAEAKLQEVADGLGLSADQLADRLVPDFGLSAAGTLTLDYGPRRFVGGFDENLRPYVADEDGSRRKDLPKPAADEDPAAYERWAAAKKGVRRTTTEQVNRLERAMVGRRRWTGEELRLRVLGHPLLWPIARRLVWLVDGVAVRIAEDHTPATLEDAGTPLADNAEVRLAHPADLGDTVAAWRALLDDYAILQPFLQMDRPVYTLSAAERGQTRLSRFDGRTAPSVKLTGLERRGWRRVASDGGTADRLERDLPDGGTAIVALSPGIFLGAPAQSPDQQLVDIWLCPPDGDPWARDHTVPFGALDPVSASELLRDLTEAC
jgi:hypothetical protein